MAKQYQRKIKDLSNVRSKRRGNGTHYNGTPKNHIVDAFDSEEVNGEARLTSKRNGIAIDGRTLPAKVFRETLDDLTDHVGEAISAPQRLLIRRAAALEVDLRLQEADAHLKTGGRLNHLVYPAVANTQNRILKNLGIKRKRQKINPRHLDAADYEVLDGDDD